MGGTFLSSQRPFELDTSFPYYYGSLVFMIPPGHPYNSFKKLFLPFDLYIWLCIMMLLLFALVILIVLKTVLRSGRDFVVGRGNTMPLINLILICLGGAMTLPQLPQRNFARTILTILLIATLILRNAYQGNLFNYLRTHKTEKPLYYRWDIFHSDFDIYLSEAFLTLYRYEHPEAGDR